MLEMGLPPARFLYEDNDLPGYGPDLAADLRRAVHLASRVRRANDCILDGQGNWAYCHVVIEVKKKIPAWYCNSKTGSESQSLSATRIINPFSLAVTPESKINFSARCWCLPLRSAIPTSLSFYEYSATHEDSTNFGPSICFCPVSFDMLAFLDEAVSGSGNSGHEWPQAHDLGNEFGVQSSQSFQLTMTRFAFQEVSVSCPAMFRTSNP
jgi:hypothetical protein